ncbi:MAG TPA: glycogen/starch/alpha-glucan phosphorylase [Polyangia bacterium]|jgi:starch phosphorylase
MTQQPTPIATVPPRILVEDDRSSLHPKALARAFLDHLLYSEGHTPDAATLRDSFESLALVVRDRLVRRWIHTQRTYDQQNPKRLYYLSAEFLLGRALSNGLISLGVTPEVKRVLQDLGLDLEDVCEEEPDAGLGNGGLGRLAACFLDSLATLDYPAYGYGIRYQFGIFEQIIRDGWQVEKPELWLKHGMNPWEIARPERAVKVDFYGRTEHTRDHNGKLEVRWVDTRSVVGLPFDTPIPGYGTNTVSTLRLWQATASEEFDLGVFNAGDYERAVQDKNASEVISKVLYPNDESIVGKELRLKQEYFFVRCALADIVGRHLRHNNRLANLPDKAAMQLNDTHPAIAVAELMRLLIDEHGLAWEPAWEITRGTIAYTNHTVLSEALERWSVDLFGRLLPRHLEIIFEINRRFLEEVERRWPGDGDRKGALSLIEEGRTKKVRMAHLALVGAHAVNGVAALHSEILKRDLFHDFHELYPERFSNKTNGVTPRRWLLQCNPRLASAITARIGAGWPRDLDQLARLAPHADDPALQREVMAIKHQNKVDLATFVQQRHGVTLDPSSLFDMQVKRLHEYKRQLLNVLHIIALYGRARRDPGALRVPRTFLFGAKAAPGYFMAKLIIRLINAVGDTIRADPAVRGLSVYFVPNYRVSLAERMIPACDLSEQISTAGLEASGTGNMKLSLNGALTIGTLDGANVEIREQVGAENFFLFGMTAEEVARSRYSPYSGRLAYERDAELRDVIDLLASGHFSPGEPGLFRPLVDALLGDDHYRLTADFRSYCDCQRRVDDLYLDPARWARTAILNMARMGYFSSDRTIRQYAQEIWGLETVAIEVPPYVSTDQE